MKHATTLLACTALVLAQALSSPTLAQAPALDYWQNVNSSIDALSSSPTDADHLYFASRDGYVGASRDGGQSWRWSALRQNTPNDIVTSLAATGGDTVLASCLRDERDAFYRSVDGGQTWTRIRYDNFASQTTRLGYVAPGVVLLGDTYVSRDGLTTRDSLAVGGRKVPDGQGGILAVEISGSFGLGDASSTYFSDDAGRTWDTVATRAPWGDRINFGSGYTVAVRSRDRYAISFTGRRDIVVTTDGGRTFATVDPGVSSVSALTWSSDTDLLAVGNTAAVSRDAGSTWERDDDYFTGAPGGPTAAVRTGDGDLLLAFGAAVYRGPEGGGAATLLRSVPANLAQGAELVCADSTLLYAYSGADLYRSDDAGVNWTLVEGDAAEYRPLLGSPAGVWAVRTSDRDLYLSTDRGETWTLAYDLPTSGFNPVQSMFRAGETGLVVQLSSGTFVSYDDGATWAPRDATGARASDGLDYAGAAGEGTWIYQNGQGNTTAYYVTRDSGTTFTSPGTFGNQQRGAGAAAVSGRLFATPGSYSDDGGITWLSYSDSTGFEFPSLRDVWFRNRRHGAFHDGDGQRGLTTFDGGRTWQRDASMVPRVIDFRDTSTALAFDPTKGLFRFADGAPWGETRLPSAGISSATEEAFAKTVRVFPNPVARGGSLCLGEFDGSPRMRSPENQHASLIAVDGRRAANLVLRGACVRLPENLNAGVYLLRVDRSGIARVVVE